MELRSKKKAARDVMRWNDDEKNGRSEAAVSVMRSLTKDIIRGCARPVGPESSPGATTCTATSVEDGTPISW